MQFRSTGPEQTRQFAAQIAVKTKPGTVYALVGTLGTGKTEFVRGFVAALSPKAGVCSPSFTLVNTYQTDSCEVHHFDFYRLNKAGELFEIGYYEYINTTDSIVLIEWADMFPDVLPQQTLVIKFSQGDGVNGRIIDVE